MVRLCAFSELWECWKVDLARSRYRMCPHWVSTMFLELSWAITLYTIFNVKSRALMISTARVTDLFSGEGNVLKKKKKKMNENCVPLFNDRYLSIKWPCHRFLFGFVMVSYEDLPRTEVIFEFYEFIYYNYYLFNFCLSFYSLLFKLLESNVLKFIL